jgi:hypothetical protein
MPENVNQLPAAVVAEELMQYGKEQKRIREVAGFAMNPFAVSAAMKNQTNCDLALVMFTDEEMYMRFEWDIDGVPRTITRTIDIADFTKHEDMNTPIAKTLDEVSMLAKGIGK